MRSRTSLIVALLGASFLTTAFIAARAVMNAVYQRETAERIMRDFAKLAADEFARGADAQIEFYGCYPLAQKIATGQPVPSSPLVRKAFRIDTRGNANPDVPPALQPLLAGALKKKTTIVRAGNATYYIGVNERMDVPPVVGGLELEPKRFPFFFANVMRMRRLLPRAIGRGGLTNGDVYIRVFDGNATLFTTPGRFDAPIGMRRELTIDDGVLVGLNIEASIDRAVAPAIVFGGLPQPPLALYGAMLIVNLGLLVTAVLQLRKERALARLRSDFISGVSHELRTPLTQIRMFAETLLLDRVRSGEERQRSLTIIDQETRRLAHLVDNILQFSRGERGTLQIAPAPHDLAALVRETVDAFAPIAKARGVTVALELPDQAIVDVDQDAMRQVILNLLDNAVKYGPAGQRVIAGVRAPHPQPLSPQAGRGEALSSLSPPGGERVAEGRVRGDRELYVDDEGPGVPPNERDAIFERYRRLERDRERAIAGMGIGLSVVRELVALHGGTVRVESGSRGGARFVVTL